MAPPRGTHGECGSDQTKRWVYASLLVDVVRRHSLLPSDHVQKRLRLERTAAEMIEPNVRKAIFSSNPTNVATNTWQFFFLNCAVSAIMFWNAFARSHSGAPGSANIFSSILVMGGQPVTIPSGGEVAYTLTPSHQDEAIQQPYLKDGQPRAFGTVLERRCGLSRCGKRIPPTLEVSDDGKMTLVYHPGDAPTAVHGIFVVPGSACNRTSCGQHLYKVEQVDGKVLRNVDLKIGTPPADDVAASVPMTRTQYFGLHTHWTAYYGSFSQTLVTALIFSILAGLKLARKTRYAHVAACTIFWVSHPLRIVSWLGMITDTPNGIMEEGVWASIAEAKFRFLIASTIFGAAITFSPRFPDIWLSLWGIALMVMAVDKIENDLLRSSKAVHAIWPLFYGLLILALRIKLHVSSKIEMRKQREEFDDAWEKMLAAAPVESGWQLKRLEKIVGDLELSIPSWTMARQYNLRSIDSKEEGMRIEKTHSLASSSASNEHSTASTRAADSFQTTKPATISQSVISSLVNVGHSFPDPSSLLATAPSARDISSLGFEQYLGAALLTSSFTHDPMSPVTSMDQLWTQAMLLRGFLLPKVLDLAQRSNGFFPVRDMPGVFEKPTNEIWMSSKGRLVMGGVKSIARGTEKVDVAYGGDVSRLLDVCRERIIFENVKDLSDCIEGLANDPEVQVVRVKSSMTRAGLNPVARTGYKFVSINLRIRNTCTKRLAISEHVCEVLFVVRSSARLMTPELDAKYIAHRNCLSLLHFCIIPGSNLPYEGRRLATAARHYITDLFFPPTARLPTIDLGSRPERGILKKCGDLANTRKVGKWLEDSDHSGVENPKGHEEGDAVNKDSAQKARATAEAPDVRDCIVRVHDIADRGPSGVEGIDERVGRGDISYESDQVLVIAPAPAELSSPLASTPVKSAKGGISGEIAEHSPCRLLKHLESDSQKSLKGTNLNRNRVRFTSGDGGDSSTLGSDGWETSYGVTLSTDDISKLEDICKVASLGLSHALDKTMSKTNASGLGRASLSSMIFVADASTIASSRLAQMLSILVGVCAIAWGTGSFSMSAKVANNKWIFTGIESNYSHFKYTNLADRSGAVSPGHPGVMEFGILYEQEGTCARRDAAPGVLEASAGPYAKVARKVEEDGPSIAITFQEPVPFYGWYLKSPQGGADTSNFDIYAKNGDDGEWALVGRPSWKSDALNYQDLKNPRYDTHGTSFFMPKDQELTLFEPAVTQLNPPFPGPLFFYGLALLLFGIMGFLRLNNGAAVGFATVCIVALAREHNIGVQKLSEIMDHEIHKYVFMCGSGRGLAFFLAATLTAVKFNRAYATMILVQVGCFFSLALGMLGETVPAPIGPVHWDADHSLAICATVWGFLLSSLILRNIGIWWGRKLIKVDETTYQEVWNRQLEFEEERAALESLKGIIARHRAEEDKEGSGGDFMRRAFFCPHSKLHHCNRKFVPLSSGLRIVSPTLLGPSAFSIRGVIGGGSSEVHPDATEELRWDSDFAAADFAAADNHRPRGARSEDQIPQLEPDDLMLALVHVKSVPGHLDETSHVTSLDQLYMQAMLLHDILGVKIKKWALQSEGYLPTLPIDDDEWQLFCKWSMIADHPVMKSRIEWPPLKLSARCFEKLARSYRGQVSRLLDITRFSLWFDRIEDITTALNCIMSDPQVHLLRIKNNMSKDADVSKTAGFCSVHLNLRVSSPQTEMLGCEMHICEVQLVLRSFGETRTRDGHRRYVRFRDLRGE